MKFPQCYPVNDRAAPLTRKERLSDPLCSAQDPDPQHGAIITEPGRRVGPHAKRSFRWIEKYSPAGYPAFLGSFGRDPCQGVVERGAPRMRGIKKDEPAALGII